MKKNKILPRRVKKPNKKFYKYALHVGTLLKWIKEHKTPDDALILYQRIEDVYFDKYCWKVIAKPDHHGYPETDDFVVVESPIGYKGDNNLYLTAHY